MDRKFSAGDDVDSYCTRCRLDLGHIIIAMMGEKIVKVKCKTCGSTHSFRNTGVSRVSSTVRRTGASERKATSMVATIEAAWQAGIAEAKGPEVPYNMGTAYKAGDVIGHSVFGKGIVQRTEFRKCLVIFRDKERMLVSSNT